MTDNRARWIEPTKLAGVIIGRQRNCRSRVYYLIIIYSLITFVVRVDISMDMFDFCLILCSIF